MQPIRLLKRTPTNRTRIEHDKALEKVIVSLIADDSELFKQFMDNPQFKRWLSETTFGITYPSLAS